jgi:hypothetical protein
MLIMKNNYVPITLDQYLNESKTITLKRGYGERGPVVVGSNAPIRNQILSYVAESQRVSKMDLKRFIAGLNEGSRNPNASAIMWLKRNSQFFVAESAKDGQTYYRLSDVGIRLTNKFVSASAPLVEGKEGEKKDDYDFLDTKKGYPRKGITDDEKEKEKEDEDLKESKKENRIKSIIENMKAKSAGSLNEDDKGEEADELSFDDLDLSGEEEKDKEGDKKEDDKKEGDDLKVDDKESDEGEEKVEITEFIITVDNAEEAIKELDELGIPAEKVEDEGSEEKSEEKVSEAEETPEGDDLELGDDKKEGEEKEGEEKDEVTGEEKIKVSVDHWEALKGWLEGKGVDVEEMFGGEIEVEEPGEEGLELDIDDEEGDEGEEGLELDLDDEEGDEGEEGLEIDLEECSEGTDLPGEAPVTDGADGAEGLTDKIADRVAQKIVDKM